MKIKLYTKIKLLIHKELINNCILYFIKTQYLFILYLSCNLYIDYKLKGKKYTYLSNYHYIVNVLLKKKLLIESMLSPNYQNLSMSPVTYLGQLELGFKLGKCHIII
jgi:hypothetical protein